MRELPSLPYQKKDNNMSDSFEARQKKFDEDFARIEKSTKKTTRVTVVVGSIMIALMVIILAAVTFALVRGLVWGIWPWS